MGDQNYHRLNPSIWSIRAITLECDHCLTAEERTMLTYTANEAKNRFGEFINRAARAGARDSPRPRGGRHGKRRGL